MWCKFVVSLLCLTRVHVSKVQREAREIKREAPKFVSTAGDHISVGYKTSFRMGSEIKAMSLES